MESRQLNVLVCPLDWGLGHASRMIPVIKQFIKDGHNVMTAGTGRSAELLMATFPDLPFFDLPSPEIRLGGGRFSHLRLFLQLPGLIISVFSEHHMINKIIGLHPFDILISDNRYGLFCKSVHTVFVTHQISPVLPGIWRWLEYPVYRIIRSIIQLFDECWIPDFEDPDHNISGRLSHRYPLPVNARYIGILSRFSDRSIIPNSTSALRCDLAIVLSGPEPQITAFENLVCKQLKTLPRSAIIIKGMRAETTQPPALSEDKVTLIAHLEMSIFASVLLQAGIVICRSGYSGIMDLISLDIQAILIPTPGQSEQEYLASRLAHKGWFQVIQQKNLDIANALQQVEKPTRPDFRKEALKSGLDYYRDLYVKCSQHDQKSDQKA